MRDPREILARIRAQADAATEGPWTAEYSGEQGNCVLPPEYQSTREAVAVTRLLSAQADAEFIAAARTTVPALLDALEKVLERHAPMPIYVLAEDCEAPDDHQHGETPDGGDDLCWDEPTGEVHCRECFDRWGESVEHPCPTFADFIAVITTFEGENR